MKDELDRLIAAERACSHLDGVYAYFRTWKVDAKEIDNLTLADVRHILTADPINLDHFVFREACNNAFPAKTE